MTILRTAVATVYIRPRGLWLSEAHGRQAGWGSWGPGLVATGMQISNKNGFLVSHGHGCRCKEPSDLSPTRPKTLNEDVFLRPNGHFEDSDGQHAARLPPEQHEEEAGETGENPPLLSLAGC